MDELRRSVLKDLGSMMSYCYTHGGEIKGGACCQNHGFVIETDRYLYRLRCNPVRGDYTGYLSCFDKQAQKLAVDDMLFDLYGEENPRPIEDYETTPHQGMTMGGM